MMSVLKSVGKGILYIIGLPFFLIILVGVGIAGIFVLIFMFFKSIILFFTGRSLDDELPEDREAKKVKENNSNPVQPIIEQPVYVNNPYPQQVVNPQPSSIEEAVFGSQQERIPFENEVQPVQPPLSHPEEERTNDEIFESMLGVDQKEKQTTINVEQPQPKDEPIGQYIPHKATQRIVEEKEEEVEEDHSASNILFGGDDD